MTTNKERFSILLNNPNSDDHESAASELLHCLHSLASLSEGRNQSVDVELSQFKTMIESKSSVADLKQQVKVISDSLTQVTATPETKKLAKLFKLMPAEILVDEILELFLSEKVSQQVQKYRQSLTKGMLATNSLPTLIKILASESPAQKTTLETPVENKHLIEIASPLLRLFSQLELSNEQDEALKKIQNLSKQLTDLNSLCMFLEDVSHLILRSISNASGQFETFLVQLKLRLDTVGNSIILNDKTQNEISDVSDTFSENVSTQVTNIKTSFTEANNRNELESAVANNLEAIVNEISNFDSERKRLKEEASSTISDLEHELEQTRAETDHLKDNLQQQRNRALTDPLTKLPNRHAYDERSQLEFTRWNRYKQPLTLIMGDIDFFKKINDTHGHIVGDTALIITAELIQETIRSTDFIARIGGEEFVLIMPETALNAAAKAINKIRILIQNNTIKEGDLTFQLSMSFGVASFEEKDTFQTVLERADKALYRAKSKGRNQVCVERKQP